ncbi:MAG: hypothetical protein IJ017_01480 [Oscillospiraceae bacterium]|nr:hypothetical protein [Oscillospiraceae bacterium]
MRGAGFAGISPSADGETKYNHAKTGDMCGGFCTYQPANVPLCGALQQAAAFSCAMVYHRA